MTQSETPIPPEPPPVEEAPVNPDGELTIRLFARTDVGQVREHNEDNFLVGDLTRRSRGLLEANRAAPIGKHGALFAVCDGMGGAAAGEVASQLAVDIIFERITEGLREGELHRDDLARRLVHAVEIAGTRIFQEAKADRSRRGMGTTVTAAALVDDHLFLAQVGDSRGYILRGESLVQVTRDQSLVNQLIEAGQLTEEEAETFEHNNIILQALGTSDTVQVDLTFAEIRRGDTLLLCSDGLSGMVRFEEIRELLRSSPDPLDVCKALTERANQAGGHDNITVIVVHFDGDRLSPPNPDTDTLKYRKYPLPEPSSDSTSPMRVADSLAGVVAATPANAHTLGHAKTEHARSSGPPAAARNSGASPSMPAGGWAEGPGVERDDAIDIPGTHVPAWTVLALVVGVVAVLTLTAVLLLRP